MSKALPCGDAAGGQGWPWVGPHALAPKPWPAEDCRVTGSVDTLTGPCAVASSAKLDPLASRGKTYQPPRPKGVDQSVPARMLSAGTVFAVSAMRRSKPAAGQALYENVYTCRQDSEAPPHASRASTQASLSSRPRMSVPATSTKACENCEVLAIGLVALAVLAVVAVQVAHCVHSELSVPAATPTRVHPPPSMVMSHHTG